MGRSWLEAWKGSSKIEEHLGEAVQANHSAVNVHGQIAAAQPGQALGLATALCTRSY